MKNVWRGIPQEADDQLKYTDIAVDTVHFIPLLYKARLYSLLSLLRKLSACTSLVQMLQTQIQNISSCRRPQT